MIRKVNLEKMGEYQGYSARFVPSMNIFGVEVSYLEAVPKQFEQLLKKYANEAKRMGEEIVIYLGDDFLDLNKSPIAQGLKRKGNRISDYLTGDFFDIRRSSLVNLVKKILEENDG